MPSALVTPDQLIAQRAARQWGVVSIDELRGCGLDYSAVARRARSGRLHRLYRGVFAVGHANPPLEGRFLAGVKAAGLDSLLSFFSSGSIWEMVEWDGRIVEVSVPGTTARVHPGLRVHRSLLLDERDRTVHRGIPVTTPARTAVDLAAVLDSRRLRRAIREGESRKLFDLDEVARQLIRLRPRKGAAKLERILASGPAPTRSVLEDAVLDIVVRGGLEQPDVNVPMTVAGRTLIPDFRWPAQRLIVEADGRAWHSGRLAREDDAERQALLEVCGERVVRVTWEQAIARPEETLRRIVAAGAPQALSS